MIQITPRSINDCLLSVTSTATLLYTLVDTASGSPSSANYYNSAPDGTTTGTITMPRLSCNAVSLRCEDGNIRIAIGATPTSAKGFQIPQGTRYFFHGDVSQLKLIRTGAANVAVEVAFWNAKMDETVGGNTDQITLAVEPTIDIGNVQTLAADTTASGTVSASNAAGGTQIVAANTLRAVCQFQNQGAVDVYYGTGTVTSSYDRIVANGTAAWISKEALKVLSSGAACNISFTDYSNS